MPLFTILVHLVAETSRHARHDNILREQLDAAVGTGAQEMAIPQHDPAFWSERRREIEAAARSTGFP